jgi:DNA adenine methylase
MTSIFCRVGGKSTIRDIVISKIPDNFDLYVEPFIGGGSVFLNMNLENKKSVINDLDKDLIEGHKSVKKGITLDENNFTFSSDPKVQEDYYKKKHTNHNNKFIAEIIRTCGTFSGKGTGKIYGPITKSRFKQKIKNAKKQKEYYKNTQILSTDYKNIIKKFDNSKTFFYLDPPYEKSDTLYKDSVVDLEAMANLLKNIKGRFLLSINDSPNVRNIFKNFDITMLRVRGKGNEGKPIGGKSRSELLIKNY